MSQWPYFLLFPKGLHLVLPVDANKRGVNIAFLYRRLNPKHCALKLVAVACTGGGRLREVPSIVTFGILENWSLKRGGRKGKFDCTSETRFSDYPEIRLNVCAR